MCKINYAELKFDHIVVFKHEDSIFATARENGNGKTRLFLIFGHGKVYTRNGLVQSWEILPDIEAMGVREKIQSATGDGIAIYQINGTSQSVAGDVNADNN